MWFDLNVIFLTSVICLEYNFSEKWVNLLKINKQPKFCLQVYKPMRVTTFIDWNVCVFFFMYYPSPLKEEGSNARATIESPYSCHVSTFQLEVRGWKQPKISMCSTAPVQVERKGKDHTNHLSNSLYFHLHFHWRRILYNHLFWIW